MQKRPYIQLFLLLALLFGAAAPAWAVPSPAPKALSPGRAELSVSQLIEFHVYKQVGLLQCGRLKRLKSCIIWIHREMMEAMDQII